MPLTGTQLLLALLAIAMPVMMIVGMTRRRDKWGLNTGVASCPTCGEAFPRVRRPANFRQAMWGGGTCEKCGTEVDKWGKPV